MSQSIFCLNNYQIIPLRGHKVKNMTITYRFNVFNVSKSKISPLFLRNFRLSKTIWDSCLPSVDVANSQTLMQS